MRRYITYIILLTIVVVWSFLTASLFNPPGTAPPRCTYSPTNQVAWADCINRAACIQSHVLCDRVGVYKTPTPDYSYTHWRQIVLSHPHATLPPACTLPTIEQGLDSEDKPVLCAETGRYPSPDQFVAWTSYQYWDSCLEFHSKYACKQLGD